MTEIASSAALFLAGVLVWAAAVKAYRPAVTAASFARLDLRGPAVLARLVPLVEAAVAVLLLVRPRWGGWAALALLSAFSAVLVPVVRAGRDVGCGCFGAASASTPVSAVTLARNAALGAAALVATAAPRLRPGWAGVVAVGAVAAAVAVVLALLQVRRDSGPLFRLGPVAGPTGPTVSAVAAVSAGPRSVDRA